MMLKVGITGGIGSGKSIVCKIFSQLGIPVFYADEEAKKIFTDDAGVMQAVKKNFGEDVYDSAGILNRKKLADIVFHDKQALVRLNAIIHPATLRKFDEWMTKQYRAPYVIKEAAILFESGAYTHMDVVVAVSAPEALRIQRVMRRDGVSREEVMARIAQQMDEEERNRRAGYVIVNDETQLLIPQILSVHQELLTYRHG